MLNFVAVACFSGCVSAPKVDLCSIDFDADIQEPYLTCSPSSGEDDYKKTVVEALGYICLSPTDYADTKAFLRHLLRELDQLDKTNEK